MREEELRHLVDTRTHRPGVIAEAAARRLPARSLRGEHGRLMVIAADHPARGALRAGMRLFPPDDNVAAAAVVVDML